MTYLQEVESLETIKMLLEFKKDIQRRLYMLAQKGCGHTETLPETIWERVSDHNEALRLIKAVQADYHNFGIPARNDDYMHILKKCRSLCRTIL